jgi:hypothetical protein
MSALFATGEPFSAAEIVAAMTRLHAESETYLAAIPAAEFAAPQGEKWSPADHVRHLAKSTYPLVGALGLPKLLLGLRFGRSRTGSRSLPDSRIYRRCGRPERRPGGSHPRRKRPPPTPPPGSGRSSTSGAARSRGSR